MKRMKKLFALLMTLAMVMGLGITGFAADQFATTGSITVNGLANVGSNSGTYVRILVPDIDAPGGYSFADGVTIKSDENTTLTAKQFMDLSVAEQKALLSNEYTRLPAGTNGRVNSNTTFTVNNLAAGYYVVYITNTTGEGEPTVIYDNPMILSIQYDKATLNGNKDGYNYNVSSTQESNVVTAKYTTIPSTKTGKDAEDEDEFVGVDGTATYEIITYIPSDVTTFTLTDRLTDAEYQQDTVKVDIEGIGDVTTVLKNAGKITFDSAQTTGEDHNMVIDLTQYVKDVTPDNANAGKKVTITYDVTVTGTKVENSVTPDDGKHDYTTDNTTETLYTGGIKLTKYDEKNSPLAGASFVVYKEVDENEKTVKYYAQVTNGVLTGWTKNKADASKLTTVTGTGIITVDGLDLGKYYFEEVEAPEDYSINPEIKEVEVKEANTNKMEEYTPASTTMTDTKLIALPSTGGMGTTLFTIAGCVIMISAAGLFFATRKKAN